MPTPQEVIDFLRVREAVLRSWPVDWPGREVVHLGNVGDPGGWLLDTLERLGMDELFDPELEHEYVDLLAVQYLTTIREQGYPLPSDFGDSPGPGDDWTEEDEAQVSREFRAFLACWRERYASRFKGQRKSQDRA